MKNRFPPILPILIALVLATASLAHDELSGLRHWEVASPDPDRIFLSFSGDPATSRAVSWRTDTSITEASAEIAPATASPKFDGAFRRLRARTEAVDLSLHSSNQQGIVHYHSAVFNELEPDTLYAYRVGAGDHWSEWIQFRTAKSEPAPFSFVYFGDAQNEILDKWSRVIRMSYQVAPEAQFAIHAGDLVNNGHIDNEWAQWFKAGGWIHRQRTGIPVVGNHEYRPIPNGSKGKLISLIWRPQFVLPEEPSLPENLQETAYTVDYQGVRIIALNCLVEPEAQAVYLREQLARPGANWTIVTSHYSIFSPRPERDNYPSSKLWLPVIEELGADLVLQGHDHLYARGQKPVREVSGESGYTLQTMFITSVSGAKQYKVSQEQLDSYKGSGYRAVALGEQMQFFQVIAVEGNQLTYTAYTADGEVYDRAILIKDPETGLKYLENR